MIDKLKSVLFILYKIVFYLMGKILPKDNDLIMFESFLGKQYSDSPRAIYEYLKEHNPDYKMFWSVERNSLQKFKTHEIIYVQRFSIKWIFLMNRAKYWVTNSRLPLWIPKPKNTIYVQTWHGTPLKRLAADMDEVHMPGISTEEYKKSFITEAEKWDYLISPNKFSTEIFKRAFQFDKKILETGYPRNDYLINCNNGKEILRIKQAIQVPSDKKIILYVPTWRDNQFYGRGRYRFDIEMDLDLLNKELSDEYVILLRMHYLVSESLDLSKYDGFVFDLSYHEDIRELYLISDILVTDYSSVFFDYANLKRPLIFYVYDIAEYRDRIRGFYIDFEKEAPGPLVKTTEELLDKIKKLEESDQESETYNHFYHKFCYLEDGNASARVVRQVFSR